MNSIFGKKNYLFMFASIALLVIGFVLLSGGEASDPYSFSEDIFNTRRLIVSPFFLISGFSMLVYSIMLKP
ncbi:DUF3098 domain-containing protein [Ichthyobacterium seriolicida]|uniref:DUF3098 domain-containing protein n=1 Tax=Ichthyobacterium seriolicida TaxID=242600 RepID=A0A1J1EBD2_9FLAO|nr:DUF3098 domain-containing protein [Ichthyobacterium seriolicida]BAV95243.1 hypothetical protein JBKA6_1230 [Ichthyobacterium seriolicida]